MISSSIMRCGRVEKVQPDHAAGIFQNGSHLGNRQGRCVGGKYHIRPADTLELFPDVLFDLHVFQNRFNNQIHILQVLQTKMVVVSCFASMFSRSAGFIFLLFDGVIKCFANRTDALFQGRVVDIPQHGLETALEQAN